MKLDEITKFLLNKYGIKEETEQEKAAWAAKVKQRQEEERKRIAARSQAAEKFLTKK